MYSMVDKSRKDTLHRSKVTIKTFVLLKKIYSISNNAVLFNSLFIKESWKKKM